MIQTICDGCNGVVWPHDSSTYDYYVRLEVRGRFLGETIMHFHEECIRDDVHMSKAITDFVKSVVYFGEKVAT